MAETDYSKMPYQFPTSPPRGDYDQATMREEVKKSLAAKPVRDAASRLARQQAAAARTLATQSAAPGTGVAAAFSQEAKPAALPHA